MKIKEILELTKTKTMAEIAKEKLSIGEKPARLALKEAGCFSIVGERGWFLDDDVDQSVLEKSIYEFSTKSKENTTRSGGEVQGFRKRYSFDIEPPLVKKMKLHCIGKDIPLYEGVETAIREYLERNSL